MPDSFTPNLNLTEPQVGGSADTWGDKLNADLVTVDAQFASSGTGTVIRRDASNNAVTSGVNVDKAAGNARTVNFTTSLSARWKIGADTAAEGGSNAGSDYRISRYADAGSFLGDSVIITRSTGRATFETTPYVGSNQIWHAGNDGAGSGLDADTLGGVASASYALLASPTFTGTVTAAALTVTGHATFSATDWLQLPSGTTGQEAAAAAGGRVRWNSTLARLRVDYGAAYQNVFTDAEISSTAQAQAGTDNATVMTPAAVRSSLFVTGFQYAFTSATTSTTFHAGTAYPYSHTVAPTESNSYRSDDVTIAYAAKNASNVLRVRYQQAFIGDGDAGRQLLALFRDTTGSSSAIAWSATTDNDFGATLIISAEWIVTVPDTASHTYKVGWLLDNNTSDPDNGSTHRGRRLFTIEELRVG
jgi:hypothetical protein